MENSYFGKIEKKCKYKIEEEMKNNYLCNYNTSHPGCYCIFYNSYSGGGILDFRICRVDDEYTYVDWITYLKNSEDFIKGESNEEIILEKKS